MQAATITSLPVALNCTEASPETLASFQGMSSNAGSCVKNKETLFTAMLREGNALSKTAEAVLTDVLPALEADEMDKMGDDATAISGMVMQIMVLNAAECAATGGAALMQTGTAQEVAPNEALGETSTRMNTFVAENLVVLAKSQAGTASTDHVAQHGQFVSEVAQFLRAEFVQQNAPAPAQTIEGAIENMTQETSGTEKLLENTGAILEQLSQSDVSAQPQIVGADEALKIAENFNEQPQAAKAIRTVARDVSDQPVSVLENDAPPLDTQKETLVTRVQAASGTEAETQSGENNAQNKKQINSIGTAESAVNQAVIGAPQQGEATVEKASAVEKALNRFVEDLRIVHNGTQEIQIVLEPASIGTLTISVTKTESGISAKIKSEDKELCAVVSGHLQKLIATLENRGINVSKVEVVYSQTEQNMSFSQQDFSQSRQETSKGYTTPAEPKPDNEEAGLEAWQGYYAPDSKDATVEYRV